MSSPFIVPAWLCYSYDAKHIVLFFSRFYLLLQQRLQYSNASINAQNAAV